MSRRETLSRYNIIIKKLRRSPAAYREISEALRKESELQDYYFAVSQRTFQRDLIEIRSIYDIDIKYDFSRKVYFVESDQQSEANQKIMEAFDTFSALNLTDRLSDFIYFEKRRPLGTENLYGLIQAIKNRLTISFRYHKFQDDSITGRNAEPYALKEFKNRWYLLANDLEDDMIKIFSLDRITELNMEKKKFQLPEWFNLNDYFKSCFGIIRPYDERVQEVVLSFDPLQGKYIKSLPLHESQEILQDNQNEIVIRLKIYLTHDFFMEILSYGDSVRVIKPDLLINDLKASLQNTLNLY
ncbi:MAG: WYL domain-containing protein [Bacteroidales bacterium]|nr:WYL domain-containing protein [Bacteroidales bacterium]MBK8884133.1 WYL domain-containing protein [Bacteroidales bacterium]